MIHYNKLYSKKIIYRCDIVIVQAHRYDCVL